MLVLAVPKPLVVESSDVANAHGQMSSCVCPILPNKHPSPQVVGAVGDVVLYYCLHCLAFFVKRVSIHSE